MAFLKSSPRAPPPYMPESPSMSRPIRSSRSGPPMVLLSSNVGPDPKTMTCPSCGAQIRTLIETRANNKTHIIALILFCLGCFCCSCIPYLIRSCKNANHYCPSCGAFIGTYVF